MTSIFVDISSQVNSPRPNGFQKEFSSKPLNGLQKHVSYRPTSDQLTIIEAHNNEAIRSGKCGYLSDGGEESELEYEIDRYRRDSIGLLSDSDSSSLSGEEDDEDDRRKVKYEHYEPDMFEHKENKNTENKMNDESDDCSFGKSTKRHIMQEILHHGVDEIRVNGVDDFGGWDVTRSIRNSKPSKPNIRRYAKTPRVNSAFPRQLTDSKESSFLFKHHDDTSEYIKQYRQEQTVKDHRLKSTKEGEEGLLIPDPYATKLKSNMCSIAENCDFLTVYSSSTKEKVEKPKEKEGSKDKAPSELSAAKNAVRQQPRPFSDHPFIVRTLSVRDRSRMFNLAPVRNQDSFQKARDVRVSGPQPNISLEHYLNLVVPHRQLRRSYSNLTAQNLNTEDDRETRDQKPALHKKNIQLNIDGPCDPWTPKFDIKRTICRNTPTNMTSTSKHSNSAGFSRKKSTPTPDSVGTKLVGNRPELTLSRASTYHSHICSQSETIDNELSVNSSNRASPTNVQRVYGQRFRCCERIHALISSDNEESNKKNKDRHLKLSVDNLKSEKTNPVSFGSFGIRKGKSREDASVSLSCVYKLKRERQRRFNISLVK